MTDTPTLFDVPAQIDGEVGAPSPEPASPLEPPPIDPHAARDAAIAAAETHADEQWKQTARAWLLDYCRTHEHVHVDDLWASGLAKPREPRALGPLLQRLVRDGTLTHSGGYRPSVHSHMTVKPVWLSTVYRPECREGAA